MRYYELNVGEKTYKLRLSLGTICRLERKLGKNPILLFVNKANSNLPTTEEMLTILTYALEECHNDAKAVEVFEAWLDDGHIVTEFVSEIIELYKVSGLFKDANEKN